MKRIEDRTQNIKEETFEFEDLPEDAMADVYTRRSVDGGLDRWIPHDAHGPLQFGTTTAKPDEEIRELLESMYQSFLVSDEEIVKRARESRSNAFAPYSDYKVGASVKTDEGIFVGANVEISGRSTSIHAEMLAMFNAVFNGATDFYIMAVSPQDQSGDVAPCGLCQHTISQFTDELRILEDAGEDGDHGEFWLSELIGDGYSASTRHFDTLV